MLPEDEKEKTNIDENSIEDFEDFEDFYRIKSKDVDENTETGLKELEF